MLLRQFDIDAEDLPEKGQWIRLRQLSSWVKNGQLQGLFVQSSKWAPAEPSRGVAHGVEGERRAPAGVALGERAGGRDER